MKIFSKSAFSTSTSLATAAIMALGSASAAQAQEAAAAAAAETAECADANNNGTCDTDEKGEIVVVGTGSRLARPTLSSPVPLTSVTVNELTDTGDVSLGDALNDLPSLRSTYSQGNSTRFIGTAGLNILDLRGLGVSRTLVLVNGKRHVTASPGDYLVDVNTIPVDLLDRVDVVTGGNSAVYGSDAVAGVVNFVLKRDFEGFTLRGQGGISSRGDRGNMFVSGTFGKNFGDGRGNIAISGEYAKSNPLYFKDRDDLTGAYSGRRQFNLQDVTTGENGLGDGIPDQVYFGGGVFNGNIADTGLISVNASSNPASAVYCGNLSATNRALRCLPNLQPRIFTFAPDGSRLIETIPEIDFRPVASGNVIPTDRSNPGRLSSLRNTGQLAAGLDRYALNVLLHYDFSDAFRPFLEAKYVHVDAVQEGQPSFFQGGTLGTFSCSNPFLTPTALAQLQTLGRCANPATGTFATSRFNTDFGGRGELHDRDTYRIVGGFEGDFNDDWKYEVFVNYGRLETSVLAKNNLVLTNNEGTAFDGYLLAYNAVLAPTGYTGTNYVTNYAGQKVVCAVNADASTTNDRADCVPLNLFGQYQADPRALAFSQTDSTRKEWAEELNFGFSVSGDTSTFLNLPGGPVSFALGGEYREEASSSVWDEQVQSGATFLNAIKPFNPPKLTVREAFGEILLPLVKDVPFIKDLSVGTAGRVSDYNTSAGRTNSYNINGVWAVNDSIKFRANYSTAVRVPTQSDLYSPLSENFAQITDPCDVNFIGGNPNRAANCAAAGVPTGFINTQARSQSVPFLSGGNGNLGAEKGKSLTIGAVFTPEFAPGLSLTVDYYRIKVENLISAPSLQQLLNLCFDSTLAYADNPYCSVTPSDIPGLYERNPDGTFGDYVGNSVGVNFAGQQANGIDFDLAYRHTFDNGHRLSFRGIATWVLERTNYSNIILPQAPDRIKSELGDPEFTANATFGYDFGPIDLTYTVRYIGKMTVSTYEAQHPSPGICPNSGTTGGSGRTCTPGALVTLDPTNLDAFDPVWYPSAFYHNVRLNFETSDKKYNFYLGVDNLGDKMPPLGLLGTSGGDPYDTFGRYFYAGVKASF